MNRLLMAAVSCAACLAPSAAMAVTAEITATGTIPAACSVQGANIVMNTVNQPSGIELAGFAGGLNFSGNAANPVFILSQPTLMRSDSRPGSTPVNDNAVATVQVLLGENNLLLTASSSTDIPLPDPSIAPDTFTTEGGAIDVRITQKFPEDVLIPGNYTVSATLSCFTD